MPDRLDDFQTFRADLNEEILACGHLGIKRFFALDHQAYEPGPLGTKTKELLGLVASAMTASPTIWCAAAKRVGPATRSLMPSTSPWSSVVPSRSRTSVVLSPACARSTALRVPDAPAGTHPWAGIGFVFSLRKC